MMKMYKLPALLITIVLFISMLTGTVSAADEVSCSIVGTWNAINGGATPGATNYGSVTSNRALNGNTGTTNFIAALKFTLDPNATYTSASLSVKTDGTALVFGTGETSIPVYAYVTLYSNWTGASTTNQIINTANTSDSIKNPALRVASGSISTNNQTVTLNDISGKLVAALNSAKAGGVISLALATDIDAGSRLARFTNSNSDYKLIYEVTDNYVSIDNITNTSYNGATRQAAFSATVTGNAGGDVYFALDGGTPVQAIAEGGDLYSYTFSGVSRGNHTLTVTDGGSGEQDSKEFFVGLTRYSPPTASDPNALVYATNTAKAAYDMGAEAEYGGQYVWNDNGVLKYFHTGSNVTLTSSGQVYLRFPINRTAGKPVCAELNFAPANAASVAQPVDVYSVCNHKNEGVLWDSVTAPNASDLPIKRSLLGTVTLGAQDMFNAPFDVTEKLLAAIDSRASYISFVLERNAGATQSSIALQPSESVYAPTLVLYYDTADDTRLSSAHITGFLDDEDAAVDMTAAKKISYTYAYSNGTKTPLDFQIIIASYDSEGSLLNVIINVESLDADTGNKSVSKTLDFVPGAQASEVRMFLWGGMSTLKPLYRAVVKQN